MDTGKSGAKKRHEPSREFDVITPPRRTPEQEMLDALLEGTGQKLDAGSARVLNG